MRLIPLTARYFLMLFLLILGIGAFVLYWVLDHAVQDHIDEMLRNKGKDVVHTFKELDGEYDTLVDRYGDLHIRPYDEGDSLPETSYKDTLIYEASDDEYDEYRCHKRSFRYEGKGYLLTLVRPRLETGEMILTISSGVGTLLLLIPLAFFLSGRWLSRRLWRPFYQTLERLKDHRPDADEPVSFEETRIEEFRELNRSLEELLRRDYEIWLDQKQFLENASHELRTPLSNLQAKLELLLEDEKLTAEQAREVQDMMRTTKRMYRLNRSLLLLSRLENREYTGKGEEELDLVSVIRDQLESLSELAEKHSIETELSVQDRVKLKATPELVEMLTGNLLKNAYQHNRKGGKVHIELTKERLRISNSSDQERIPEEKLFERFYQGRKEEGDSWGLGLSLARKIATTYGWELKYAYGEEGHVFKLRFQ